MGIMEFLSFIFGYDNALIIKDALDNISGILLGMLILLWIGSFFVYKARRSPNLEPEIAIAKFSQDGHTLYMINPKSSGAAIKAFLGYLLLFISPNDRIKVSTTNHIGMILGILVGLLIIIGTLLSFWHYLPADGAPSSIPKGFWSHFLKRYP